MQGTVEWHSLSLECLKFELIFSRRVTFDFRELRQMLDSTLQLFHALSVLVYVHLLCFVQGA